MGTYVPARFTVTLGAGIDAPAPLRHVAATAVPITTKLNYSGTGSREGILGCCHTQLFKGTTAPVGSFKNFNDFPGYLPLAEVVACSSSFLGDIAVLPSSGSGTDPFETLAESTNGDLSTWAGSAAHEQGLTKASALVGNLYSSRRVTQQAFDGLVENSVRLTIDGGFTDVSGIANAVAAGATDIVSIVNLTGSDEAVVPKQVIDLFCSDCGRACHVQKRFAGQPTGASGASVTVSFEIFQNTQADARAQYAAMAKTGSLKVKAVDSKQLVSVVVGTFENIKTKKEDYFGVEDGRSVNLNLVSVTSKLNLGEVVDFHDYSVLVQEIISTLLNTENGHLVDNRLLPFFTQPAGERKASKWGRFGA